MIVKLALPPGCSVEARDGWWIATVAGCIPAKHGSEAAARRYVERMVAERDAAPKAKGRRGDSPMGRRAI
jgi:hypothetical protein